MPGRHHVGFDYSLRVDAPASLILAAFFDPRALAQWWDAANVVATPRPLGVYAVEWKTSEAADEVLGRYGGVLHGTVMDFQPGRGFFVADCYWLPPDGDPVGPMALEATCTPPRGGDGANGGTMLRVTQSGFDSSSRRWARYYELLNEGWPPALEKLKDYLEKGQGVWDLRRYAPNAG